MQSLSRLAAINRTGHAPAFPEGPSAGQSSTGLPHPRTSTDGPIRAGGTREKSARVFFAVLSFSVPESFSGLGWDKH